MRRITELAAGRRSRWVILAAWVVLALALAPLQPKLQVLAADESDAFESATAESTRADDLIERRFKEGAEVATVVVYTRPGGLTADDNLRITSDAEAICAAKTIPTLVRVITPFGLPCGDLSESIAPTSPSVGPISLDGTTALVTIQSRDDATDAVVRDVAAVRALVPPPDADGLRALVTGETGFAADQSASFEGIDETLLAITAVLIVVLLLAVYRSPVAAAIPLAIVSAAYLVAAGAIYGLAEAGVLEVTGQATAILIVLMFGAGTDYCLLIVSRYKEELRGGAPMDQALVTAGARSGPAILSAGGIVVAAMLVLLVADYRATATMGPVLALGTAVTVVAGLTLLPALLSVLGRRAFWPAFPAADGGRAGAGGLWTRMGDLVRRRPWPVIAAVCALLVVGALGALQPRGVLSFAESFRDPPQSVQAQKLVAAKYGPGMIAPLQAVVASERSGAALERWSREPRIRAAAAVSISRDRKLTILDVTLRDDPFEQRAIDAVPRLRRQLRASAGPATALLTGPSAAAYDSREALRRDARLIAPLTLLLVLLVVAVLVRALVAPLYLVATVVLSYAFALGASSALFSLLGQPDSDPALPIFAFVFLVALGVDYNVFLISRIREERARLGPQDAVIAGLERSGGVISSAGLILAGTFCTLIALDVVGLAQVGFTVAFGLLVDTFIVRCLLVPAIGVVLGDRSWWPTRPGPARAGAATAACVLAALAVVLAVAPDAARADTYTVDSTADSGPGSLRSALERAEARPGPDEVHVQATGTVLLGAQLPDIHDALTIRGPGRGDLRVARAPGAEHPFRILTVEGGADVRLSGLTVSGGRAQERLDPLGGGIRNAGRLWMEDVVVEGNVVEGRLGVAGGGGIANTGRLELRRSVVRGNRAVSTEGSAGGGGVYNLGTLLVEDTTVSGNAREEARASHAGAGIEQGALDMVIRRSTVSGNAGVGVHNAFSRLLLETVTVSGNAGGAVTAIGGETTVRSATLTAGAGGGGPALAGLQVDIPSSIAVRNSLLGPAGAGAPVCAMTAQVEAVSAGHNLAADGSCGFLTAVGDRHGVDPALTPLADHGGPTATHAFAPGSPAHDGGRRTELGTDQRGLMRPVDAPGAPDAPGGDGTDVGALELPADRGPAPDGMPPAGAGPVAPAPPTGGPSPAVAAPRAARIGRVRVTRVIRRRDGTARLRVRLPARGRVSVGGEGVRPWSATTRRAATVIARVRARGRAGRRLSRLGAVRVTVRVRFRATGGVVRAARVTVRLRAPRR